MSQLIETIQVIDGIPQNLEYHQNRMNYSIQKEFGYSNMLVLQNIFAPKQQMLGMWKWRMVYTHNQIIEETYSPYTYRVITSLQLIYSNTISYPIKYENRTEFASLTEQKQSADDILIVKNGHITDTSYSNIVFFDGTQWYTPNTYLLNGTKRQKLLYENVIQEIEITPQDILLFTKARLLNCFCDFENGNDIDCRNIRV